MAERSHTTLAPPASVLYLDASELAWLRPQPQAKNMLDNPRAVGWRDLAPEERGDGSWALLTQM
jgi:hypothetical protein